MPLRDAAAAGAGADRPGSPGVDVGLGRLHLVAHDEGWLAAGWPFVLDRMPAAPAAVLEIGCGPQGGFVPALRAAGYAATGVDPEAPAGPWYSAEKFERHARAGPFDAIVAGTSAPCRRPGRGAGPGAEYGPYFFADLAGTSEADEQAAIDSGQIQANRIRYTGRRG